MISAFLSTNGNAPRDFGRHEVCSRILGACVAESIDKHKIVTDGHVFIRRIIQGDTDINSMHYVYSTDHHSLDTREKPCLSKAKYIFLIALGRNLSPAYPSTPLVHGTTTQELYPTQIDIFRHSRKRYWRERTNPIDYFYC